MAPDLPGIVQQIAHFESRLAADPDSRVFLPLADKLGYRHEEEMQLRQVMLKGILSLQAGDNPRITQAKLAVFLPVNKRSELAGVGSEKKG